MKKIIAAFDGLRFSESTRDYAIQFAKQSSAHLVGVFLNDLTRHSYKLYNLISKEGNYEAKLKKLEEEDIKTRQASEKNFETACRNAGLDHSIRSDRGIAIQELLHESIYADLMVIQNNETLTAYSENIPGEFIRELLANVQCPVLMVPEKFSLVHKLLLLYDGEPSSVYAIKMFSYTLASLKQEPAEVLSVKNPNQTLHLPESKLIKEFMKRHFPKASYTVLKGNAEIEIVSYLKKQKGNPLIVLGAYRRGLVSRWFRASMADVLMKDLKFPLFIAHYR